MEFRFENLPTEALFRFFCSSDPLLLGAYSLVCKKWNQLSKDNELWRQYCLERWPKNPTETDCAKNWLIPVREGGGSKENRINWKSFYRLRSLWESVTAFINLTPGGSEDAPLLKEDHVIFTTSWPMPEELSNFEKKCLAVLVSRSEEKANEINDDGEKNLTDYIAHMDLFFELELSILRQITISRVKYLGLAGRFLEHTIVWCQKYPDQVTSRLAKFVTRYTALALQKDIPMEVFVQCLEEIALVFSYLLVNVNLPQSSFSDLVDFCSVIIKCMAERLNVDLKQWANEERNDRPISPTKPYDKILLEISNGFFYKAYIGMPLFIQAIDQALGSTLKKENEIVTFFAVLSAITLGCKRYVAANITKFMNVVLPFWHSFQGYQNTEYLLALSFYFSNILESVGMDIPTTYTSTVISPIFDIATHTNHNLQRQVATFVHLYCRNLSKNSDILVPYLVPLLDIMYGHFNSENASVRREAVIAVSSLIITCHTSFTKHKDRMMIEFKKLLETGSASDRNTVMEVMTRIGASVGKEGSLIEADVAIQYNHVVEDCKRDREAHLDLLLKMTEFGSVVLGPKITNHLPFVLPLLLEYAAISEAIVDENDPKKHRRDILEQATNRKQSALISLYNMIKVMERDAFLTAHHEIASTIRLLLSNLGQSTLGTIRTALKVLAEYTKKLFEQGDLNWCTTERMWQHWSTFTYLLLDCIAFADIFMMKLQFLITLTEIFKHLCNVSTPQLFVNWGLMKHLTEIVFSALNTQCYQAEIDGVPFNELLDFEIHINKLMEAVCSARKDKVQFWRFADAIFGAMPDIFAQHGVNEYRWLEASLICTVFDHFGYEFLENNRMKYLSMIFACFKVISATMYKCLTNYIYVTATKYPRYLPPPDKIESLNNWFDYALEPDISRESHPNLYDSSLHGVKIQDRENIRKRLVTHVTEITGKFPPSNKQKVGLLLIHQFCKLLKTTQVYFEGEEGAQLKSDVIRALQNTLAMAKYNTRDVHAIVDPVLENLQAL